MPIKIVYRKQVRILKELPETRQELADKFYKEFKIEKKSQIQL